MCGICGIYNFNESIEEKDLVKMTNLMRHRGPDDEGYLLINTRNDKNESFHYKDTIPEIRNKTRNIEDIEENKFNLGFGFRRLSIIDLTEKGHQPMSFDEAGLHIVYNGEIYNYIEIREELKGYGYAFKSNTDTEVILKSYHKWGEDCLHKFNGMWAFAISDSREKKLFCSRDRFGVKPFYYYCDEKIFIFASEIKSILIIAKAKPDIQTTYEYFANGYTDHSEHTFFEGIKQLRGGQNLILTSKDIQIKKYYEPIINETTDTFKEAKSKYKELIYDAVKLRLRSDVPLGYALSGGMDSSSITTIATLLNNGVNNTFSMVYPNMQYDETGFIKEVVNATRVNEHYITPTIDDLIKQLDKFIWHQEEPFAGLSYFGEFKLRELIKSSNTTVSLEGQGADETISGYTSLIYHYYFDLIRELKFIKLKNEINKFLVTTKSRTSIFKRFISNNITPKRKTSITEKYPYLALDYLNHSKNNYKIGEKKFKSYLNTELYKMLFYTSIPQQLTRADKSAMAFSVECRFPFLDYRLVEYSMSLPYYFKINNGVTKLILRESLQEILPDKIYKRKDKIGFALPENRFITKVQERYFHKIIGDILLKIDFVDKDKYNKHYKEEGINWKFWKTASYLLWYDKFINNNPISTQ